MSAILHPVVHWIGGDDSLPPKVSETRCLFPSLDPAPAARLAEKHDPLIAIAGVVQDHVAEATLPGSIGRDCVVADDDFDFFHKYEDIIPNVKASYVSFARGPIRQADALAVGL